MGLMCSVMNKAPLLTGTGAGTGEEVAALLGLASPPGFTQLSVTMRGQTAAAGTARVLSGSLRFYGKTEKLLHAVQRIANQHQPHVEVALRANSSADGLLLSFVGLSAELEQQVLLLHLLYCHSHGANSTCPVYSDVCSRVSVGRGTLCSMSNIS